MTKDDRLLLQAAFDGELDAQTQRLFERRLAVEPELAAALANLRSLRAAMQVLPAARAPDRLRTRIAGLPGPAKMERATRFASMHHRTPWGAIAATVAALFVGGAGGWIGASRLQPSSEATALVAAHVRGLMAGRPVDVASSDQHTVKPWFAGKVPTAPVVVDLAAAGFPLEGGRLDVVAGQPEPTLVYRHGPHMISVTRLPEQEPVLGGASHRTVAGHSTLTWKTGESWYVAVSDAAQAELGALRTAFDKAQTAAD